MQDSVRLTYYVNGEDFGIEIEAKDDCPNLPQTLANLTFTIQSGVLAPQLVEVLRKILNEQEMQEFDAMYEDLFQHKVKERSNERPLVEPLDMM